jgi:hypothetical protein
MSTVCLLYPESKGWFWLRIRTSILFDSRLQCQPTLLVGSCERIFQLVLLQRTLRLPRHPLATILLCSSSTMTCYASRTFKTTLLPTSSMSHRFWGMAAEWKPKPFEVILPRSTTVNCCKQCRPKLPADGHTISTVSLERIQYICKDTMSAALDC